MVALFVITVGMVVVALLLLALPLISLARRALPLRPQPTTWIHGREIDGNLTDRRVEELIRDELYGRHLNVSRI